MDPMFGPQAWYYVDSWQWLLPTWGAGQGQWVKNSAKGPFYGTPWDANFETEWAGNELKLKGAKYIVRRFRWTGAGWTREV